MFSLFVKCFSSYYFNNNISTLKSLLFCFKVDVDFYYYFSNFSLVKDKVMAEKTYDIVVFGASGFTGQYVVDEVARVAEEEQIKWAISGRNMGKLQKVLSESSKRTGKLCVEISYG